MSKSSVANLGIMETNRDDFQQWNHEQSGDASPGRWVLEDWGTDNRMSELEESDESQELSEAVQGSAVLCEWCQLPQCKVQLVQTSRTRWLTRLVCTHSPAIQHSPEACVAEKNKVKEPAELLKRESSPAATTNVSNIFKVVLPKCNIYRPSEYFICTICFECFKSETLAESHGHIDTAPLNNNITLNDFISKNQTNTIEKSDHLIANNLASCSHHIINNDSETNIKMLKEDKHIVGISDEIMEKIGEDVISVNKDLKIEGSSEEFALKLPPKPPKDEIKMCISVASNFKTRRRKSNRPCSQTQSCQPYLTTNSDGLPMCRICKKVSRSVPNLITHLKLVHMNVIPLHCQICHEAFKIKKQLVSHVLAHTPIDIFCDLCTAQFSSYNELLSHALEKHPYWKIVCHECGRHFITKKALLKHLNEHLSVKGSSLHHAEQIRCEPQLRCVKNIKGLYVCQVCCDSSEFSAKRFTVMLLHLMKHFRLRSFKCTVCNDRYVSKFNMELHVIQAHCFIMCEQA